MIIVLSETRRVVSDSKEFKLQRLKKVKGDPTWVSYRHYMEYEGMLKGASEQLLKESEAEGVEDCSQFLRQAREALLEMRR